MNETNTITIDKAILSDFERICRKQGLSVSRVFNMITYEMVKSNRLAFDFTSYEHSDNTDTDEEYIPEYYQFADLPLHTQQALKSAQEIIDGKRPLGRTYKSAEEMFAAFSGDK
jgi:antitoxin component of RelBE/YafQ-DinJ toxin-antitoxin module